MTIGQWLSFRGRIGRKTFWLGYILPLLAASFVAGIIDTSLGLVPTGDAMAANAQQIGVVGSIVSLLSIWPSLAGCIRRLHDRDRSGWWIGGFYLLAIAVGLASILAAMAAASGSSGAATVLLFASVLLFGYAIWLIVETGFLRGTMGPNRFGPDPLGGQGAPQWQQTPQQGWGAPQQQWQPPPAQGWQPPPQGPGAPPGYGQPPPGYGQPPQQPPNPWGGGSVPPVRRD